MNIFLPLIISVAIFFSASCSGTVKNAELPHQSLPNETVQPKPTITPTERNPQTAIDAGKITSISIEARFKTYFEQESKCRKSYNELFGNNDGYYNEGSACTGKMSVDSDGTATKTIELSRYDKTGRQMKIVEKSVWTAKISGDEFKVFAETVVNDDFIKNYPEGIQLYTSNFNVTIFQGDQRKAALGNIDNKNPRTISIIDVFKDLDNKLKWTKTE